MLRKVQGVPICYLNAKRLKQAIIASSQRVMEVQERLNQINVFPVPDGDTGTNMALTLKSVAEEAINAGPMGLSDLCERLAESAIMNSRGNSGAVLAQFLQGMAEGFMGHNRVGIRRFVLAMEHAVALAETAFTVPVEGTVITVMRDWKDHLKESSQKVHEFKALLSSAFQAAKKSLAETPQKLKQLAKAGVVDAGGQGFVNMLEGIGHLIETGKVNWSFGDTQGAQIYAIGNKDKEVLPFQFCTECLLSGFDMDLNKVRTLVNGFGNSTIVAGNSTKIRVHVHTNEPQIFFEKLSQLGTVSRMKTEDMIAQNLEFTHKEKSSIAIVTDSSCDLPMEFLIENRIHMVPVTITFGNKTFLDRMDITSEMVYNKMQLDEKPTTSQPTPGEFLQAFRLAKQNHSEVLGILLSSTISGTFQSCQAASRSMQNLKIELVDSKTCAGGLGLLVRLAAQCVNQDLSLQEVKDRVEKAIPLIRVFMIVDTMKYLVRGGRVGKAKGLLAKWLHFLPVLSLSPDGKITTAAKVHPKNVHEKLLKLVCRDIRKRRLQDLQIIISHAHASEKAENLARSLESNFPNAWIQVLQASPAIGAHVGPGACAITYFGVPEGKMPW